MAKDVLVAAERLLLPAWGSGDVRVEHQTMSLLPGAAAEVTLLEGRTRPDVQVSGTCGPASLAPLYVEVRVTHAVDHPKAAMVREAGLSMVEIDLSDLDDEIVQDRDAFEQAVLATAANRRWIHVGHPAYLAHGLGAEVLHIASRATRARDVPFRSGKGYFTFQTQSLTSYAPHREPMALNIELESYHHPQLGWVDHNNVQLPYPPGYYLRGTSSSRFKDVLVPIADSQAEVHSQRPLFAAP